MIKDQVKTITRADIADVIFRETGFSHAESQRFVDSIVQVVVDALLNAEELKISGFASFIPHKKVKRIGRNPRTGQAHDISPRTVISFKASHLLKKALQEA